ncbi:MAG: Stp1/IreP family PP2C-type Ser/Thr phosphatase [Thermoleophilia bacterium]
MPTGETLALVELAHLSDTGRVRHHNEDRALASPVLMAVADGMGGANAGEVAAQVAVEAVGGVGAAAATEDVREAVLRANRDIRRMAREDPAMSGMGTTLTAAMLHEGRLDVVHVGDSRAYLWRDGTLRQLTEDHSVVAELVRRGSITPEEAESHPHRNVITRALGAEPEVEPDTISEYLRDGDVVLLCSDGLSSYVHESVIAEVLTEAESLQEAARGLVGKANGAGGTDNVTVVLARVGIVGTDAPADTAEAPFLPDGPDASTTAKMKVLGGVHGHAGTDRADGERGDAPRVRVLEPVGRRRRRLAPALIGVVVALVLAGGAGAWVASRTYVVTTDPAGEVRVDHGLPFDLLGIDLSRPWQDTGVSADLVRESEPKALDGGARGQGEAVELAARLVWRYSLPTTVPVPGAADTPSEDDSTTTAPSTPVTPPVGETTPDAAG